MFLPFFFILLYRKSVSAWIPFPRKSVLAWIPIFQEIGSSVDADIPEIGSSVDADIPEIGSNVDADIPGYRFQLGYRTPRLGSVPAWIPKSQRFGWASEERKPKDLFRLRIGYIGFGFQFFKRWIYGFGLWFLGIGYGFRLSVLGFGYMDFGFRFLGLDVRE
ncbi:unnamed protein product [Rhizophagus irregularis]|nr:unnamed protein product [Rhizophagus irregularis]